MAPEAVVEVVSKSTHKAIELLMQSSIWSLKGEEQAPASPNLHKAAAATTGAVAGFFGLQTLIVELPVTTGIMFRWTSQSVRSNPSNVPGGSSSTQAIWVFVP